MPVKSLRMGEKQCGLKLSETALWRKVEWNFYPRQPSRIEINPGIEI